MEYDRLQLTDDSSEEFRKNVINYVLTKTWNDLKQSKAT